MASEEFKPMDISELRLENAKLRVAVLTILDFINQDAEDASVKVILEKSISRLYDYGLSELVRKWLAQRVEIKCKNS